VEQEAAALLNAILAYNKAHEGDSDDSEIDAAFEMAAAAIELVRQIAGSQPHVGRLLGEFERAVELPDWLMGYSAG
jgi:hypothetical protein